MVRRRLKLIILCDAAADPKFSFADLNSVRRQIRADFGARISFEPGCDPEQLTPRRLKEAMADGASYAVDADMAERGFLLGRIEYATPEGKPQETGALVYIKTTMVDSVSFGVKAY